MKEDVGLNYSNDNIDLIKIIKSILEKKHLLFKMLFFSFFVGCIISLLSPIIYESQTTFVPQTSDQNTTSSKGIGSLASLAGINLNAEASSSLDNYISPLLYTKIAESEEFSLNIINNEKIIKNGDKISIKDYLLSSQSSISINPVKLIFKLINFVTQFFTTNEKNESNNDFKDDYNFISQEDYKLINILKQKFSIQANEKEGYIRVSAIDNDAFVSTQLVKMVTKNLQSNIIKLRTNKIKEQLGYSKEQYLIKKEEFEKLQNKLAKFRDSNKNISTAVFLAELERLESEYKLQQNIMTSLANEYNSNKIKLNKNTPIFSVLDEVSVPNQRSKPKRSLIILIYTFMGFTFTIIYIFFQKPISEIIKKINK